MLQDVPDVRDVALLQSSFAGCAKTSVEKNNEIKKSNTVFLQINWLNKIAFIMDICAFKQDIAYILFYVRFLLKGQYKPIKM